jgi:hypothetical protein
MVSSGSAVRIADGAAAGCGDLIVCTRNDHAVEAGEPGRTLANGDLLRIDSVTADGLMVRPALDADPATGRRRWTDRQFLYANFEDAELGYAVTDHTAQGRTVHTGLAVITGAEDRQHACVALTRGTDTNTAYVFTLPAKLADPRPGPRLAPSTDPTSAACPTGRCCTCATPTPSKLRGPRSGSATNSARSASAPRKPSWRPSAPAPRPTPPSTRASMNKLISSRF